MKNLNRKVFFTIFSIISVFLIISIVAYNIQNYRKEYEGIQRNLNFVEGAKPFNIRSSSQFDNSDMDNMLIMNYEVYTVKITNDNIIKIIGHSGINSNFDVENIALSIIDGDSNYKIGNLYNNKYAYNYKNSNTLIIINTDSINKKLSLDLYISLTILLITEIIIYFVSKSMTKLITEPAVEAFEKQKNFIADASHELKTPLAVIMASSDELKSDKKNSKYVENIKYESDRMSKLITSLLDLSKIENGISIANYKEENISKIIEKICLTFESIAYEQNISIDTNISQNILFKCSKEEIEKLISIIIDNAIKHSYKNTTIVVNAKEDKNNINIDITNDGDPIVSGEEEKIFERFYRADKSRKRDANRYGLGLAIAKSIVTNHNGNIKAFSKNAKTTFKINLKK